MRSGVDRCVAQVRLHFAGERVDFRNAVDLVAEEFHAQDGVGALGGENFHHVAAGAELVSCQVDVIALILDFHQLFQELVTAFFHAGPQRNHHRAVIDRVAQAVNARDTRHNNYVAPFGKRACGGVAQLVDLVVDGRVLFDIRVCRGNVRLRLVVVVIGDEIFHCRIGEEFAELAAQLRCQRLVVRQHECGPLHPLNHIRHRERFAGARHAQQRLFPHAALHAIRQPVDCLRLVARRPVGGTEHKPILLFLLCHTVTSFLSEAHAGLLPGKSRFSPVLSRAHDSGPAAASSGAGRRAGFRSASGRCTGSFLSRTFVLLFYTFRALLSR